MPLNILQCTGQAPTAKDPPAHHVTSVEGKKLALHNSAYPQVEGPRLGSRMDLTVLCGQCITYNICYMSICSSTTPIHAMGGQEAHNLMLLLSQPSAPTAKSR